MVLGRGAKHLDWASWTHSIRVGGRPLSAQLCPWRAYRRRTGFHPTRRFAPTAAVGATAMKPLGSTQMRPSGTRLEAL